jgi:lysophospholipase L1-like esterase
LILHETNKPRSRLKRFAQKLAVSTGAMLVCLGLCELTARLCGYGRLEIYEPDPLLYWRLKPNQDCFTKIDRKPVHINSHGTRGPEFQMPKPPGTFRILSLGDSRTFGWGLAQAETYSELLRAALQSAWGNATNVEVINAGVNAWSYPQMLAYFREVGLGYQPDCVILAEANLWTQFSEKNSPEFVRKFMSRVRLKNALRRSALYHFVVEVQLKNFYERHRTKFIPVDPAQDTLFREQQQADPAGVFRSAVEDICRLALTNHIRPIVLFLPALTDMESTNTPLVLEVKRGACTNPAVTLVDLTPDLKPQGKALYLEADPVHFNAQGNELIARRLFETMTNFQAR